MGLVMSIDDLSRDANPCTVDNTTDRRTRLLGPLGCFVNGILDLGDFEDVNLEVLDV